MANYTWLGDLCGSQGGMTISKGSFDGLVGAFIDGNNLYSGKIIRDSAVAVPLSCDFPGSDYMTSTELKDGTYDRYNYSREHDFNIICIPGIDVHDITEVDQSFYAYWNGACTKPGSVFSQLVEQVPDTPRDFPFSYTLGCDEEDLEYNDLEVEIVAGGTAPIPAVIQDWIVEAISYYTSLRASGMVYNQYTYMHPCVTEMKDNFFAAYTNLQDGSAGYLSLFKFDFITNTATEVASISLGTFHCTTSNNHAVSNQYLVWDETGSRLFLGDMMYTGSKPNQGQILVYDVDLGLETLTYSSTIANPVPSRYGYFGGCIAVDGGPDGSGQIIAGDVATMAYYFFDPVTLVEIPAHKILITKSNIGSVVAAYNGILWYQSPDGLIADQVQTVQMRWNGSVWVEQGLSRNNVADATGFVTAVAVTKFSCPSGLTERPFMHCVNGAAQAYNGPDNDLGVYNVNLSAPKIYGVTNSGGGFGFGAYYESYNIKRYDPNSGAHWYEVASYDDSAPTNGNALGYGYMLPISVNDPLDPDVWRILDMYNDTSPYDIKYDVINTGMGAVLGYPAGNFYLKHTVDVSLWANINSASQVSGAGTDDEVRWVISTDGGATWHTVQSAMKSCGAGDVSPCWNPSRCR
jgi:hypothetical protein